MTTATESPGTGDSREEEQPGVPGCDDGYGGSLGTRDPRGRSYVPGCRVRGDGYAWGEEGTPSLRLGVDDGYFLTLTTRPPWAAATARTPVGRRPSRAASGHTSPRPAAPSKRTRRPAPWAPATRVRW